MTEQYPDNQHLIINVGRQIGSGGRIIARRLADEFGCRFFDREVLDLAACESGISQQFFEQSDEQRGFFRSLFHLHAPHIGDNNFYADSISQESLFKLQSDAIRKAASESSCVFVGRCADYVLRDFTNVVNIFITADMEQRVERLCERNACDTTTASKLIANGERQRSSYYQFYTGKRWGHSESYDLCINSSLLGLEETIGFISDFIRKKIQNSPHPMTTSE